MFPWAYSGAGVMDVQTTADHRSNAYQTSIQANYNRYEYQVIDGKQIVDAEVDCRRVIGRALVAPRMQAFRRHTEHACKIRGAARP